MPKILLCCLVVTDGESHEIAPVPLLGTLAVPGTCDCVTTLAEKK